MDMSSPTEIKLSRWQRFVLWIWGEVSLGYEQSPMFVKPTEVFALRCKKHGLVKNYRKGFDEWLGCPLCYDEWIGKF